jgi:3-oxo-5-alpha-steroid 4-dehydrogenase 1
MESPVFFAMLVFWLCSPRRFDAVPLIFLCLFQLHYFNRSFIYPMLLKGRSKMPLGIIVMGVVFNLLNAAMQGLWIFYLAPEGRYSIDWLTTPQFIIGVVVFFAGMVINMHSDHIIRHLRKPGDTGHYLPKGGMFRYVSSANYFGEILEWTGFAILTWSAAGAVFAIWTFANLVPRADAIYQRYAEMFGEEFRKAHLKRVIPFIY